ncbi:MAG: hypothetical protein ABI151_15070 [Chitinophagaceae bacterium]
MKRTSVLLLFICVCFLQCTKNLDSSGIGNYAGEGGSLARFAISGNYLYTVDDQTLTVYDITAPGNPVLKNRVSIGFSIETIYPFKENLFIGSSTVIYIYSIADPLNPKKLSEGISPEVIRRCDPVVAKDTVAFATLRTSGPCGGAQSSLVVFNIKDISHPIQKASINIPEPYGLGYSNDALYVCDITGLYVFDISDPYRPVQVKLLKDAGSYIDVIAYQGVLICWVKEGIVLYDISNNKAPKLLARIL